MRSLPSIRHRIAPLHSGSLQTGSALACIVAPDRPQAPHPIHSRNAQLARSKSNPQTLFDLMQSPDRCQSIPAARSVRPNPHSARRADGCPTHRDFVPWRFSDAGRSSPWMVPSCRRPKTLYERELVKNFPHGSSFRLP